MNRYGCTLVLLLAGAAAGFAQAPKRAPRELPSDAEAQALLHAPVLTATGPHAAEFESAYRLALRVVAFNLRNGLLEAGEGYGTWTRDSAINSWNAASLLIPASARQTLWHECQQVEGGRIVGGQYWDKVIWIIAAWNHARVTGDATFLTGAFDTSLRTLDIMREAQLDSETGLFRGPAVYGDGVAAYPDPPFDDSKGDNIQQYPEGKRIEVLSTNCVYYGAYRAAAAMGRASGQPDDITRPLDTAADSLRVSIRRALWMPAEKRFAYFRDGAGGIDKTQEGLGEALAVLLDVADPDEAKALFHAAQLTPWGVACTWPPFARYRDANNVSFGRHNGTIWPFINGFWATAAAHAGEGAVFAGEFLRITQLALRSGDFREIYHPYTGEPYGGVQAGKHWDSVHHQTWSATGYLRMVYQGLFGMDFQEDGLQLRPTLPNELGIREAHLTGLHYRDAELDITVAGDGKRARHLQIDGKRQAGEVVPAKLTGKHAIVAR